MDTQQGSPAESCLAPGYFPCIVHSVPWNSRNRLIVTRMFLGGSTLSSALLTLHGEAATAPTWPDSTCKTTGKSGKCGEEGDAEH